LLWYIAGDTNVKYLQDNGVRIWNEWAKDNGDLGPVYGKQWRDWERVTGAKINYEMDPPRPELITERIDQLANAIDKLKNNPDDRRMIVNSWNVGQLDDMQLPPCHYTYQFYSAPMSEYERERVLYKSDRYDGIEQVPTRKVSCKMTQRSCDVFLGVPFNIAQYSILTHMIAQVTGHHPGEFIWDGGDVHLYDNHVEQAKTQLGRDAFEAPRLALDPNIEGIDDFSFDSFELIGYNSHNTIKAKVAV
jgi:thymidylate synthase